MRTPRKPAVRPASEDQEEPLSWELTYEDMAREREDWSDLDVALADGLDDEPW